MSNGISHKKQLFSYKQYLTEGLIILTLTILVYALVYAYNYGYYLYFGIPFEFASFSVTSIFNATSVIAIGVLSALFAYSRSIDFNDLRGQGKHSALFRNIMILFFFLAIVSYTSVSGGLFGVWLAALCLFLYTILRYAIYPLIYFRKLDTYDEKADRYIEKIMKENNTPSHYIWNFALYKVSTYVMVPIMLFIFVINHGYSQASIKREFFIPDNSNNFAVAKFIDDKAILVKYTKSGKLKNEIKIISVTDKHTFIRKDIGQLKN